MRGANQDTATPYCRCRVLYLGSSVPHASKEGLLGVQEPLRELYPEQGALGARGIDSWLSVWSNGLLLENVDEHRKKITRFFPIEALHYCAAVRHVKGGNGDTSNTRFLPLDSPFARTPSANHPPLFAAVLRRTTGIKVLECHAFICKRDMAANALVRCCFHAYADSSYAKGLEPSSATTNGVATGHQSNNSLYHTLGGSSTTLDSPQPTRLDTASTDDFSLYNGDENHKVWARGRDEVDGLYQEQGTLRSTKGSRPRQLVAPPPPPPPPPPPAQPLLLEETSSARRKANKKLKKMKTRSLHEDALQQQQQQQQQQLLHHQLHQGVYANGHGHHTLGHPIRQQHYHHHPLPPSSRSVAGTLARPAPMYLVPAATLPRKSHHHPRLRPIPAAAPIVPVYAPLPVVPPTAAPIYPPATYGTAGNRGRRHPEADNSTLGTSRSIRAEHRSRSHGSLASLGFSAQNGNALPKEEKKDREIAQLVAGLNLNDGSERTQPPNSRGGYHHHQQQQIQPLPRPRPR
ncbi:PREDICTED: uncharacterized protein LOC108752594 isoform X2 [Trachymyrmex septentrionalis]|uniref:uncharacterized protein LOC108752594 isoform X2 n=1 Tax=Trachymyrmex septentrionalis TaxID=34720 RepID=UPI00084F1319|nr:PREDICTED: uncharacterized protein LOC108752594 isoform X2 [Trachymyrmex septentrionalis]